MSEPSKNPLLLVFKGLPIVPLDTDRIKSISYSDFLENNEYSICKRVWLFIKNEDTYDGTYVETNIIRHSKIIDKILKYLELGGYRLGKYDSIGERRYQIIEGLVANRNPEYCEIHLETSKAEEVAAFIVNFLIKEKGEIHISMTGQMLR